MTTDIVDLRAFYLSPLGHATRRLLRQKLRQIWPDLHGMHLLALGFATPVLRPWLEQTNRIFALMPAAQGVVYWPKEGPNRTALADTLSLPLPDNSIDRVLLLHVMESATDSSALLREVWRVLKSGGRMITVVPNRRGIWAMSDATPFGAGQPFSPSQLKDILRDNSFLPEGVTRALYLPPWQGALWQKLGGFTERWGAALVPTMGGVLLAEASKQLYAPVNRARIHQKSLNLRLPIMPQPGSST
ncbi:MAG: methyltransferase domain-containing protein [Alphaproteobacteria bacterium]